MNIRTLSQITPLDGAIHISSYIGVSQYSNSHQKYSSRKVRYEQLSSQLSAEIDKAVLQDRYHATNGGVPINLSALNANLSAIMFGEYTFEGVKKFSKAPQITANVGDDDSSNVPNVKLVREMIDDNAGFMAENQYTLLDPENGTYHTVYDEYEAAPKQMYWHIDHD